MTLFSFLHNKSVHWWENVALYSKLNIFQFKTAVLWALFDSAPNIFRTQSIMSNLVCFDTFD